MRPLRGPSKRVCIELARAPAARASVQRVTTPDDERAEPPMRGPRPGDPTTPLDEAGRERRRAALLALLGAITETRLHRPAETEGWTLRHLIGAVAAADRALAHVLDAVAADPPELAEPPEPTELTAAPRFALRRLRGEVMYRAHMRNREGLAELLAETGAEAERALSAHGWLLDLPIEVEGSGVTSARDLLAERGERERAALQALRAELPPGVELTPGAEAPPR